MTMRSLSISGKLPDDELCDMKPKKLVVIILAVITALESLSIDLYLPAFAKISETFRTVIGHVQLSLSLFLAGFAIGQLFWGPLSDRHGRKPVLVSGLGIFVISTVAIHFVGHIALLWVCRFLQAFGGCAGIVMSRAIVADLFSKEETVKIFARQTQISGVAPIIAPMVGSVLLGHWGWQSIFTSLSVVGSVCLLAVVVCIPESHMERGHVEQRALVKRVFANRQFVIYTLVGAMAYSALMIYISSAPFLLIQKAGLTEQQFSIAFGVNSLALVLAAVMTPRLMGRLKAEVLVVWAAVALTLCALGSAMVLGSPAGMLILLFLSLIPVGILFPLTTGLGLAGVTDGKGTAAAFMGCIQLTMSFLCSGLVSILQHSSAMPMVWMRTLVGIAAVMMAMTGLRYMGNGRHTYR